jgi:DNA-binding LacI/PurR family transcriptional regulator
VLRVAEELGWAPSSAAKSLSGARTEIIGPVLAREYRTLGAESFHMRFIAGIESELTRRGYALLLQLVPSHDVVAYGAHVARRLFDRLDGQPGGDFPDGVPVLLPRGTTGRRRGADG